MYSVAKWSVEDYHKMIEAGILSDRPVELISGEILEMSPQDSFHTSINHIGVTYHGLISPLSFPQINISVDTLLGK